MFYILYWLSAGLLVLGTVGYPVVLWLWPKSRTQKAVGSPNDLPKVSIILPCFNEENFIGKKINNLLNLDYPPEKLEIVLVSDGSTDRSEVIIDLFLSHPQLKFISLPERGGKPKALNQGVAAATGNILVFSDTRQQFNRDCLLQLVPNFSDKKVGGVSGTLIDYTTKDRLKEAGSGKRSWLAMWFRDAENKIKVMESQIHSVVGVYGALYAIRRELYTPLPADIILDDMQVPFDAIRKGYRVVFEPKAMAVEDSKSHLDMEVSRRERIFTGKIQFLFRNKNLFNPRRNPVLMQLFLHKYVRLLFPFLLLLLFISNLFINDNGFYQYTLLLQMLFYALCLLGLAFKSPSVFYLFSRFNISVVQGFYAYLIKSYSVKWPKQV
jgi:poly-beta-1,6-N-acetyl-D-glucosamine synthase